jgi:hypothetical protein
VLKLEAAPGFGRLYATAAQANASPGALAGHGSSFTLTGVVVTSVPFHLAHR